MASTVSSSIEIHRPVGEVFAFVDDQRNMARHLAGLAEWRPLGERESGPGARFAMTRKLRGLPDLHGEMEVVGWRENEALELRSHEGFDNVMDYVFAATEDGTRVSLTLTYDLGSQLGADGAGFFGAIARRLSNAAGRAVQARMAQDLRTSLERLRSLVEANGSAAPAPAQRPSTRGARRVAVVDARPTATTSVGGGAATVVDRDAEGTRAVAAKAGGASAPAEERVTGKPARRLALSKVFSIKPGGARPPAPRIGATEALAKAVGRAKAATPAKVATPAEAVAPARGAVVAKAVVPAKATTPAPAKDATPTEGAAPAKEASAPGAAAGPGRSAAAGIAAAVRGIASSAARSAVMPAKPAAGPAAPPLRKFGPAPRSSTTASPPSEPVPAKAASRPEAAQAGAVPSRAAAPKPAATRAKAPAVKGLVPAATPPEPASTRAVVRKPAMSTVKASAATPLAAKPAAAATRVATVAGAKKAEQDAVRLVRAAASVVAGKADSAATAPPAAPQAAKPPAPKPAATAQAKPPASKPAATAPAKPTAPKPAATAPSKPTAPKPAASAPSKPPAPKPPPVRPRTVAARPARRAASSGSRDRLR